MQQIDAGKILLGDILLRKGIVGSRTMQKCSVHIRRRYDNRIGGCTPVIRFYLFFNPKGLNCRTNQLTKAVISYFAEQRHIHPEEVHGKACICNSSAGRDSSRPDNKQLSGVQTYLSGFPGKDRRDVQADMPCYQNLFHLKQSPFPESRNTFICFFL